MGSFIAALRHSKGMTQRELAQLLHVSDKPVSRWETGEGAPDLALIPAIAEMDGVCDELLRGERKSGADAAESTPLGRETRRRPAQRVHVEAEREHNHKCAITLSGLFLGRLAGSLSGKYGAYEWTCVCTALAHGFAWDVAMACIISFAFAVFACVLAYALMYSRDFFG